MLDFFNKNKWSKLLAMLFLLGSIYCGVRLIDFAIDHFSLHQGMLNQGATKITRSHFRQPEKSIFDKDNFSLFLENVTRHEEEVLALKPFYVILLGLYLVIACLVIIKVICTDNSGSPEIGA